MLNKLGSPLARLLYRHGLPLVASSQNTPPFSCLFLRCRVARGGTLTEADLVRHPYHLLLLKEKAGPSTSVASNR